MDLKMKMPIGITQLITSGEWKGGNLVQLESEISRPSSEEVILNYIWLRPFVQASPEAVCSGFFIADCFLMLDRLFVGQLLQATKPGDTKLTLAAQEATRIKLLMGSLRNLWRSSISTDIYTESKKCKTW